MQPWVGCFLGRLLPNALVLPEWREAVMDPNVQGKSMGLALNTKASPSIFRGPWAPPPLRRLKYTRHWDFFHSKIERMCRSSNYQRCFGPLFRSPLGTGEMHKKGCDSILENPKRRERFPRESIAHESGAPRSCEKINSICV